MSDICPICGNVAADGAEQRVEALEAIARHYFGLIVNGVVSFSDVGRAKDMLPRAKVLGPDEEEDLRETES